MTKPTDFILNSEYATLKNSQIGLTASVTVPSGAIVAALGYREWYQDIPIEASYAISSCRISSSKYYDRGLVCNTMNMYWTHGSLADGSINMGYDVYCFVRRLNATTVRFAAIITNTYNSVLTCDPFDETFNLVMNTFVPPFA